jgi:hypothetical protein
MSYISSVIPTQRIEWDARRDNTVMVPGFTHLGDTGQGAAPAPISASRSAAADGKPFVDITDTYTGSGSPVGYRYRQHRVGIPFLAETWNGSAWVETFSAGNIAGGWGQLTLGNTTGTRQNRITQVAAEPNGILTGSRGDIAVNINGGAGRTLWIKESGDGTNTGWVGK